MEIPYEAATEILELLGEMHKLTAKPIDGWHEAQQYLQIAQSYCDRASVLYGQMLKFRRELTANNWQAQMNYQA